MIGSMSDRRPRSPRPRPRACVSLMALLALSTHTLHAQDSISISGVVVDTAGQPIPAAIVYLEGPDVGMIADGSGRFALSTTPVAEALLRVERIGYRPWSHRFRAMGDTVLTAVLVEAPLQLDAICTMDFRPAVVVEVIDSVTGGPLGFEAVGQVRDGAFVEDQERHASRDGVVLSYSAAGERKGVYHVAVSAAGYRDWTAGPVEVGDDPAGCHVDTARLVARMVRERY